MKFLLLFLISFSLYANYIPVEDIGVGNSKRVFMKKKKCKKHYDKKCVKVPVGYNHEYHIAIDEMVNDFEKPAYEAKSEVELCIDQESCELLLSEKTCPNLIFINAGFTEVYCTKLLGYAQKKSGKKLVVEDKTKKAAWDLLKEAKKDQEKADKKARKKAKKYFKDIDCSTLASDFEINVCNYIKR